MKKLLTFFLTALLTFSVGWAETVTDVLNRALTGVTGTTYTNWSGKTSNSNAVYAGNSAGGNESIQLRTNSSNSGIVSTTSGGKVKKITVVWNSNTTDGRRLDIYGKNSAYNAATDLYGNNKGTLLGYIVYGTSTELTINGDYEYVGLRSNSGAMYLTSISIEWETGGSTTVAPPTFDPADGATFPTSQQVTISAADGATIYYNYDNGSNWNTYSAPLTLTQTTTVYAYAELGGIQSTVASATYTKNGVATIAEALALELNTNFVFTGNVAVTACTTNYVWLRDNTGSGVIYLRNVSIDPNDFPTGTILAPNWLGERVDYHGMKQFRVSSPNTITASANTENVEPFERTTISDDNMNEYVIINGLNITGSSTVNSKTQYTTQEGITLYDYFDKNFTITTGKTYNVTGVVGYDNQVTPNVRLYITNVEEVASITPLLVVSPTSLTINDSGTNNTFTVEGSNLGTDNVGLNQTDSNFDPTLSATTGSTYDGGTYWGFTPAGGSVNGTVTMNYTGRELSASETVTLGNNTGASATVTVNYLADLYIVGNFGSGWDFSTGTPMTYNNGTYTANVTVNAGNLILFARKYDTNELWNTRYVFGPNSSGDWWVNGDVATGTIDLYDDDPVYFVNAGTYTIEINASTGALTITKESTPEGTLYEKVTSNDDIVNGEYLIVYETDGKAFDGSLDNMDPTSNVFDVTINNNKIITEKAAYFTIDATAGTIQSASGYYIGRTANSNGFNQSETEAYTHTIAIDNSGNAIITSSSGPKLQMWSQMNNGVMQYRFRYYTSTQKSIQLYRKHSDSTEPRITVNPASLNLEIPAGGTSQEGTVAVTEINTTGTTSVSINGDTNIFSATLENGTLTVTYNGTATQANPDQATITLTNGTATATVTVTGYKVPMTVTITPGDGHTFSTSTVTGLIESNVADALIEYSFDGNSWITYDPDEGFTTPEVANVGGTVTVYARATYNGETTTSQVTYTRVEESMTCTADIVFDPTSNNGGVTTWETLQTHMSEGTDYISDAEMATVFTSNDYDSFRFGSGNSVGHMTFTLKPSAFTGGAVKLTKVTINAARYSNDTDCELNVSTDVNTTGVTQAITAAQSDFDDYVFNFDGSEITTLTIKNLTNGKRVYVHSITLEYNCEISLTLADLVADGVENKKYTITDELQVAKVTWDDNQHKFAIFAKDDEMYADKSYPTDGMDSYLIEYVNQDSTFINDVPQENYDQSNWIEILIPNSNVTTKASDAYESELADLQTAYENKILKAGQVRGTYINALNPTIVMTTVPEVESSSEYSPNYYCPGNFLMENLDTDGAQSYRTDELAGGSYFMMEPKPQEFCKVVWAYFDGVSSYFVAAEREGDLINGLRLRGSFKADMSLCEDKNVTAERSVSECFAPSNTNSTTSTLYGFNAIVRKVVIDGNQANGAPHRIAPYSDGMEDEPTYIVYPLNSGTTSHENVTNVDETLVTKTVVSVHYYNMMGMESRTPFDGINVVVTRYSDGSTSTLKVIK